MSHCVSVCQCMSVCMRVRSLCESAWCFLQVLPYGDVVYDASKQGCLKHCQAVCPDCGYMGLQQVMALTPLTNHTPLDTHISLGLSKLSIVCNKGLGTQQRARRCCRPEWKVA